MNSFVLILFLYFFVDSSYCFSFRIRSFKNAKSVISLYESKTVLKMAADSSLPKKKVFVLGGDGFPNFVTFLFIVLRIRCI